MDSKLLLGQMGVAPVVTAQRVECPVNSARGLRELEMEKALHSLNADTESVILMVKKGWPSAS